MLWDSYCEWGRRVTVSVSGGGVSVRVTLKVFHVSLVYSLSSLL